MKSINANDLELLTPDVLCKLIIMASSTVAEDSVSIIHECLKAGGDINFQPSKHSCPIVEAYLYDNVDVLEYLIQAGASIEIPNSNLTIIDLAMDDRDEGKKSRSVAVIEKYYQLPVIEKMDEEEYHKRLIRRHLILSMRVNKIGDTITDFSIEQGI